MSAAASTPSDPSPRKLKILMLHGYTQSGPLFHAKTRALEKSLQKAFPSTPSTPLTAYPGGVHLIYPTGPLNLRPSDIPGYTPSGTEEGEVGESEQWGWWRKSDSTGEYTGLEKGLDTIVRAIREAGGVDGVIGFSQGAAAAILVASLLDDGRFENWRKFRFQHPEVMAYPDGFLKRNGLDDVIFHPPLKFAISYSGFYAPHPCYAPFYNPKIRTPSLHFIGTLDSVVEEERSLGSAQACVGWAGEGLGGFGGKRDGLGKKNVVFHPGGHFVPVGKEMVGVLVGFLRGVLAETDTETGEGEVKEESVEDMDMPF